MIFGDKFTGMMLETHLATYLKGCFTFFANLGVRYRVIFFRGAEDNDTTHIVQRLILSAGRKVRDLLDEFV